MKLCVCLATSKLARVIYSGPSGKVDHRCNVLSFTDSSPSSGPYRSTVPQLWSRRNYQWITRVVTLPRLCYIKKYESLCWSDSYHCWAPTVFAHNTKETQHKRKLSKQAFIGLSKLAIVCIAITMLTL